MQDGIEIWKLVGEVGNALMFVTQDNVMNTAELIGNRSALLTNMKYVNILVKILRNRPLFSIYLKLLSACSHIFKITERMRLSY